jgi:predicted small secreted protein
MGYIHFCAKCRVRPFWPDPVITLRRGCYADFNCGQGLAWLLHQKRNEEQLMRNTKITRFFILLLGVTWIGLGCAGCKHTANGAGQDIEQMGQKIQEKTE